MCSCNQHSQSESHSHCNECFPIIYAPIPKPNYVLGRVLECPPPCGPNFTYPNPSCVDPVPVEPHFGPSYCTTIYDMVQYLNIQDKSFSFLLNPYRKNIVGFFITFVDNYGYTIPMDNNSSTLQVEEIYQYYDNQNPGQYNTYYNVVSDTQSKYYYTYIQQNQNGLPYNGCIWTLYLNSCNELKLSFNLSTTNTGPINMFINLFLKPEDYPSPILAPVIEECIEADPNPNIGHIRWMVELPCHC